MASNLPAPSEFKSGEDFTKWVKSVEIYMGALNIKPSAQKVNILLHLLGPDIQEIVETLPDLGEEGDEYEKLKAKLGRFFKPKVNVVVERHTFSTINYEGGRVEAYVAQLRNQARKCDFSSTEVASQIRDKLVATCPSMKVKEQMLKEDMLSLERAIQIWALDEEVKVHASKMNAHRFSKEEHHEANVNTVNWWKGKVKGRNQDKYQKEPSKGDMSKSYQTTGKGEQGCFRCGKNNHMIRQCKVPKHVRCHRCSRSGHLEAACRRPKEGNTMAVEVEDDFCVYHTSSVTKAIKVGMNLHGSNVDFVLDTGCPVTLVPHDMLPKLKLTASNCKLKSYTGHEIPVLGEAEVVVKYKHATKKLKVHIVEEGATPLLGRNWLKEICLDWKELVGTVAAEKKESLSLDKVLSENAVLFNEELGTLEGSEAKLELKEEAKPVFCPARSVPYGLAQQVENELEKWKQQGVIEELSHEEPTPRWATPLVVVPKADGSVRLCGDFKVTLNPQLNVPVHPLPKVEDMLATLGPVEFISVIDLSQAYLQMKLSKESQEMCYLNTPSGLVRMLRLPYGVASSPALWQREMDRLFKGTRGVKCLLDDIIITGSSEEEALARLNSVLAMLKKKGLKLKKSKCVFMTKEVKYLGVRLGADGVKPDPERLKPVLEAQAPSCQKELREFLGAVTFYGRFIKNLAQIAHPLNCLLKKDVAWNWTQQCAESFSTIKAKLASAEVMTHFDTTQPVTVITDASPGGLGAVLVQGKEERPVVYVSRSLTQHEAKYSQIEKEGLCVVWAFQRLRQYLYGRSFTLVTDNRPLSQVIAPGKQLPALAASRIQRWSLKLAEYQFKVEVRRSQQIPVADWLSRLPSAVSLQKSAAPEDDCTVCLLGQLDSIPPVTAAAIAVETARDPVLSKVIQYVQQGWPQYVPEELHPFKVKQTELTVEKRCILWGMRVVIPPKLRSKVSTELHSGHQGMVRMKQLARSHVWWPQIDKDLEEAARSCEGCREKRADPRPTTLHPWAYAEGPWQRVHADFAGPVNGTYYLVVVDSFTKWMEISEMRDITSARTINTLLHLFARWGIPHQLVTDNGPQLTSAEFEGFLSRNGVRHILTAPYKPSTNGAAERAVGSLKGLLKATKGKKVNLPNFLLAYRNTPHATTGRTPAELMLGRPVRSRLDLMKPDLRADVRAKQTEQVERRKGSGRTVSVGDSVLARDYRGRGKWQEGEVVEVMGDKHYLIQVHDETWKRHIDQVLPTAKPHKLATDCAGPSTLVSPPWQRPADTTIRSEEAAEELPPSEATSPDADRDAEEEDGQMGTTPDFQTTTGMERDLRLSLRKKKPVVKLDL